MVKFLQLYSAFLKQQIKALIEYRLDFAMGMIGLAIFQIGSFLVIFSVFTQIKSIGGYTFNEILLFYGYSQILRGIDHIYNDNLWSIAFGAIKDGKFSQYLLRPINPILHIIMEKIQFDGFGELLIGIIMFIYAKSALKLNLGIEGSIILLVFSIAGLMIYFATKLICAAISFWTMTSGEFMVITYEVNSFTKYPLDIYKNRMLKFLLTYILPFAMVSYLPLVYFIREKKYIGNVLGVHYTWQYYPVVFVVCIAISFLSISLFVWNRGLKRYQPPGN
ncbi:ABC-2 family transporter protein [Clostridium algoriphilum]|uniref:ABC transporter permease n=1 Tax=Clostridium algoriphilum TaxID=198347 RepID=UPI001CF18221|nr:ABC-2 family transporter protein [Clostridium algoriphilum]MCB2295715.1 ABC-2 family transporter protein [Clostridium algoriphilum]